MKKYLPLNLQFFATDEDDDMILPEGFEDSPPEEPEAPADEPEEGIEAVETEGEDTTPPEEPTEPEEPTKEPETPQKLKIKFNHEERELDLEEAAALAQKGMNYDKAVERARQEARDAVIADMGYTWNNKPITTEAEYKQAMMEQQLIEKYKDRDLPEEVIQELMESRRDREERQKEKTERETETKKQEEFNEFFAYFQEVNERPFDPAKDTLPQGINDLVEKGVPLKYAYMQHHNNDLQNQLKISKQNQENLKKAPVKSVTAGGGAKTEAEDPFLVGFDEDE